MNKNELRRISKKIVDSLKSNSTNNQLDLLKSNLDKLIKIDPSTTQDISGKLLYLAIITGSKETAIYLNGLGAKTDYNYCIRNCKYDKIKEVCDLISEIYQNPSIDKLAIINRLISPDKVIVNKKRLEYTITLIGNGFLDKEDVRSISKELYSKKETYKDHFKMVSRELFLTELGI